MSERKYEIGYWIAELGEREHRGERSEEMEGPPFCPKEASSDGSKFIVVWPQRDRPRPCPITRKLDA